MVLSFSLRDPLPLLNAVACALTKGTRDMSIAISHEEIRPKQRAQGGIVYDTHRLGTASICSCPGAVSCALDTSGRSAVSWCRSLMLIISVVRAVARRAKLTV